MATYYWVGGAGTWNNASSTNWSLSSGGSGGAGVPTQTDDVVFNVNSDVGSAYTVSIGTGASCRNLTASGLDRVLTINTVNVLNVYGDFSIPSTNITISGSSGIVFSGSGTITTNGILLTTVEVNTTGTYQLIDNLTLSSGFDFRLTSGTIDINSKTLSFRNFNSTGSSTKVIAHGVNGNIDVGNEWLASTATNITTTGSGSINMNGSVTKQFAGGGNSYATLNQSGTATLNVTGNNTFQSIKTTRTSGNVFIFFANGSTTTFTQNFELNRAGTASVLISASSTSATFTKTFSEPVIVSGINANINVDPTGWYLTDGFTNANWAIISGRMMGLFF